MVRRVKSYSRYYRCVECGHVFRIKHAPTKEVVCPLCGGRVVPIKKSEYDMRKSGVGVHKVEDIKTEKIVKIEELPSGAKIVHKKIVKKSLNFTPTKFIVEKNDDEDNTLVDFVLTSGEVDSQNQRMGKNIFHNIVDEVNKRDIYGTIEHAGLNPDETDYLMKQPIMKLTNAELVDDKVFATARFLPHPYKQQVIDALKKKVLNGVSIELSFNPEDYENNTFKDGELVGFSFVRNPALDNARVFRIREGVAK